MRQGDAIVTDRIVRALLPLLEQRHGVPALSREFVWEPRYAAARFERMGGRSVLWQLLHLELTAQERELLFPGQFDLGNLRPIPDEMCTEEALWNLLFDGKELSEVQRLLRDVSATTGHEPHQHFSMGVGQAFKVAVLLHRVKSHRPALKQLWAILRPPSLDSASLELTNPYPAGAPSELRFHLEDLRAYLSVEIVPERLSAIDGSFGEVRPRIDAALEAIEAVIKQHGSPSVAEVVRRYGQAAAQWQLRRPPPARRVLRADEQMYVHLHVLDFLHFAQAERRLRSKPLLRRAVTPVAHRLKAGRIPVSALGGRPLPAEIACLHEPLREALGEDVTLRQFRENLADTELLLRRRLQLMSFPPAADVDALTCLAAMVVARELKAQPQSFTPRLHGASHGQSSSVKAALRRPLSSSHEEFGRILRYAVDWTRYALAGQTAVHEAKLAFEMQVITAAEAVLNTHDAERVDTFLANLEGYARSGVRGLLQAGAAQP